MTRFQHLIQSAGHFLLALSGDMQLPAPAPTKRKNRRKVATASAPAVERKPNRRKPAATLEQGVESAARAFPKA